MGKEDYKNEKKGHGFLCVPKELLFDNRYKQLTIEAILLYAYISSCNVRSSTNCCLIVIIFSFSVSQVNPLISPTRKIP